MPEKDIWDLELHEVLEQRPYLHVVRVPGGWLYVHHHSGASESVAFVPFVKKREV